MITTTTAPKIKSEELTLFNIALHKESMRFCVSIYKIPQNEVNIFIFMKKALQGQKKNMCLRSPDLP
jgi:hypothetical protein